MRVWKKETLHRIHDNWLLKCESFKIVNQRHVCNCFDFNHSRFFVFFYFFHIGQTFWFMFDDQIYFFFYNVCNDGREWLMCWNLFVDKIRRKISWFTSWRLCVINLSILFLFSICVIMKCALFDENPTLSIVRNIF